MSPARLISILLQVLLLVLVLVLTSWVELPWTAVASAGALGLSVLAGRLVPDQAQERAWTWGLVAAWGFSVAVIAGICFAKVFSVDLYHAVMSWMIAAIGFLTNVGVTRGASKGRWNAFGFVWALFGSALWLEAAYRENQPVAFHLGVLLTLALFIWSKRLFHLRPVATQAVNTLILLLVGLPVADLFVRPSYRLDTYLAPSKKHYSYAVTGKDLLTFGRWWRCFLTQWDLMAKDIFMPDPAGVLPLRLRPGSQGMLFDSRISINTNGFRGKPIPAQKDNTYRIVALGESTTFGCTLNPQDKPWPEVLEEIIRERLHPVRPVEVINAGVPAHHLGHALYRLPSEILPLKPDMILSYHGINGFSLLHESMPASVGKPPPRYCQRPLKLLGDAEYHLKMMLYRRGLGSKLRSTPPDFSEPLRTRYANAYRDLIEIAQTNHIRLALGNFSMAVNLESDPDVVAFYLVVAPSVYWQMRANLCHSKIVEQLSREHPEVCLVDTHPGLDGEHEKFIDSIHLTQDGRRQVAEAFFAGIRQVLEQDLAAPVRAAAP